MEVETPAVPPGLTRPGVPRVKVAVPRLSARYLSRPRLLDALDAAAGGQVTLVSAPAGFGKTQLLAEWAAQDPDRTAWVGLDDDDNDDVRFWSAVLDALESCPPVRATTPLRGLAAPAGAGTDPAFLAEVVHAVAAVAGTVRLALDDVHEVRDARTLHGLAALVRSRPRNLQLVLATRSDPPLPLARMRLDGELCELRARDLAFTASEAQAVLESAGVPVRPEQARLIAVQTEGWPAGLWLAALSLRDAEDPDAFLSDLAGNSRAVSEYLLGEVLAALPGDVLDLLHAVSVCDRVCAALAEALSGRPGAGEVLDRLERETSLLASSGEGRLWYRVHPLLRAHLHADLVRLRPGRVPQLHVRAAQWYADVGQPDVALTHALRSDDPARVALLLREHAIALIAGGRYRAVRQAVDALDDGFVARDPALALVAALAALEAGALASADRGLARAAAAWPAEAPLGLAALQALVICRRAALTGRPADLAHSAEVAGQTDGEPDVAVVVALDLALALMATGKPDAARELVQSALDTARRRRWRYLAGRALTVLAAIAAIGGDYRRMTALAEQADAELPGPEWRSSAGGALSSTLQANGALLRGDPAGCLDHVAAAMRFVDPGDERPSDTGYVMVLALRGAALVDLGHGDNGLAALRAARDVAVQGRADPGSCAMLAMFESDAAVRLGQGDLAGPVVAFAEGALGSSAETRLLHTRRRLAAGRDRAAADTLRPVLDGAMPALLPWAAVEARVLECLLALHADRRPAARHALIEALARAEATGALRPLVTAPAEIADLLISHLGGFGRLDATAERVVAARHRLGVDPHLVALTGRERDVLGLLPTDQSMTEIATALAVSASTVKTHVRAIYDKLGARSRREAVATARRRGLLGSGQP